MKIVSVRLDGTNRSLQKLFEAYNACYYGGRLPTIPVRFGKVPKGVVGMYGPAELDKYLEHPYSEEEEEIVLNPILKPWRRFTCIVLLHESAHVATPGHGHGKRFQRVIDSLYRVGAYKHLL